MPHTVNNEREVREGNSLFQGEYLGPGVLRRNLLPKLTSFAEQAPCPGAS